MAGMSRTALRIVRKAELSCDRVAVQYRADAWQVLLWADGTNVWAVWRDGKFSRAWATGCVPLGFRELEKWVSDRPTTPRDVSAA